MSSGDGSEIHSAISSIDLSLHHLHFCKFWRYFIQFNYHSGLAHEAISASSPTASQSLPSTMTPSPDFSESPSETHVQTGLSKLPKLYSFLYKSFNVATNSFILIVLSGFYLALKRYDFLHWNEIPRPKPPNLPNVSFLVFVRFRFLATFLFAFSFGLLGLRVQGSGFRPHVWVYVNEREWTREQDKTQIWCCFFCMNRTLYAILKDPAGAGLARSRCTFRAHGRPVLFFWRSVFFFRRPVLHGLRTRLVITR